MNKQRWLFLIISILITVFFLYIGLKDINFSLLWDAITHANYWWIVPGVAVYFLAVWGRTWRWHFMLRPLKSISLRKLFPIVVIGYMGNNVYPFRAGEVIRAYLLKRNEDVKITASLATIVVERIFDGLVMLIFVFAALPFVQLGPQLAWLQNIIILGTIVFFGALVVFLALAMRPVVARRVYSAIILKTLPKRLQEPILRYADHFMEGLESLRSPRDVIMMLVSSVFVWLMETTKYWFVMHAFPFQVSFFVLMIMTAVVNLATTLPAAPGYVGTFDGPGIRILADGFHVDVNIATGYTLVLHMALWLPITLLGFVYLAREGLSMRSFGEAGKVVEAEKEKEELVGSEAGA